MIKGGVRLWNLLALPKLFRMSSRSRGDLVCAALRLAQARYILATTHVGTLLTQYASHRVMPEGKGESDCADEWIERIAYAIPRVASRVPWRADCLVQAVAACRWLDSWEFQGVIIVGSRLDDCTGFSAHAWAQCAGKIVTGGDIGGYCPFTLPARLP